MGYVKFKECCLICDNRLGDDCEEHERLVFMNNWCEDFMPHDIDADVPIVHIDDVERIK